MRIVIVGNGAAANEAVATIGRVDSRSEIILLARETLPQYSACALADILADWIPVQKAFLKNEQDYRQPGIEACLGEEVIALHPAEKYVQTRYNDYSYDRLIIASGSSAVIPPVPGRNLEGNFILKNMSDVVDIQQHQPHKAVVVGAGNIGVETAIALKHVGCDVVLIEKQEFILSNIFDSHPSAIIQQLLEKDGIPVYTREGVVEVDGSERVEGVTTDHRSIPCDTVIWTAGTKPNVSWAEQAGIQIGQLGGIKVDRHMHTSVQDVFACGDCIETFHMLTGKPALSGLWSGAKIQARTAALNCMGEDAEYEGICNMLIEEVGGKPCLSMGLTTQDLSESNLRLIEEYKQGDYYRVLLVDDRIMGFQSIGRVNGSGAMFSLLRKRTRVQDVKDALDNRQLQAGLSWYVQAGDYLFPERSSKED